MAIYPQIASMVGLSLGKLVLEHMPQLLAHLLIEVPSEEVELVIDFIAARVLPDFTFQGGLSTCTSRLIVQLVGASPWVMWLMLDADH